MEFFRDEDQLSVERLRRSVFANEIPCSAPSPRATYARAAATLNIAVGADRHEASVGRGDILGVDPGWGPGDAGDPDLVDVAVPEPLATRRALRVAADRNQLVVLIELKVVALGDVLHAVDVDHLVRAIVDDRRLMPQVVGDADRTRFVVGVGSVRGTEVEVVGGTSRRATRGSRR